MGVVGCDKQRAYAFPSKIENMKIRKGCGVCVGVVVGVVGGMINSEPMVYELN